MASMSYCRWRNIQEDLRDAVNAFRNGKHLSRDEKSAMKGCCELFLELLDHANISDEGMEQVDLALMDLYAEIDEECEDDDD